MTGSASDAPRRRLWSPGRRLAVVAIAAWVAINAGALVRAALPEPLGHPPPWGMFRTVSSEHRTVRAYGIDRAGRRVPIDLTRHFRYTRGATALRVYDEPRVLIRASRADQARFARWLAAREPTPLDYIYLYVEYRHIDTGRIRAVRIGRFSVAARAGEGAR